MKVKLSGFGDLERALAEDLPKATAKNVLRRSMIKAMGRIEARARQLAPRDDGELADSIVTKAVRAKRVSRTRFAASTGLTVQTGPSVRGKLKRANASWQEYGTVKMAANPYMRPAADGESGAVIAEVRDELAAQIGKAKARIAKRLAKAGG